MTSCDTVAGHERIKVPISFGIVMNVLEVRLLGVEGPLEGTVRDIGRDFIAFLSEELVHGHLNLSRVVMAEI